MPWDLILTAQHQVTILLLKIISPFYIFAAFVMIQATPILLYDGDAHWLVDRLMIIVKVYASLPFRVSTILERLAVSGLNEVRRYST